jgi:prophage tail gpP-like protein
VVDLDTGLTVRFESIGRETTSVHEWEIDSQYLVPTDGFSFTLVEQDRSLLRGLELLPVELLVNGKSQLLGRIEATDRGDSVLTCRCEGRDYISEIVECDVSPYLTVPPGTDLGVALVDLFRSVGIRQVMDFEDGVTMAEVRSGKTLKSGQRKSRKRNKTSDFKPEAGEAMYQCAERLIARHSTTLQPGPARSTIILDSPDYKQAPTFQLTRTDDPTNSAANNILSGKARRDYSSFPTDALFTGTAVQDQANAGVPIALPLQLIGLSWGINTELAETLERGASPTAGGKDSPNVLYRLLTHRDTDSRTEAEFRAAVSRAISERLKETLVYTCTVKGHVDPVSGAIWSVGMMAGVNDAIADVNENLWIAGRKLRYVPGQSGGAFTDLTLWRPGSFLLDGASEEAVEEAKATASNKKARQNKAAEDKAAEDRRNRAAAALQNAGRGQTGRGQ